MGEFFTWGVDLLDLPAPSDGPTHSGRGSAPGQGSVVSEQSGSRREESGAEESEAELDVRSKRVREGSSLP